MDRQTKEANRQTEYRQKTDRETERRVARLY